MTEQVWIGCIGRQILSELRCGEIWLSDTEDRDFWQDAKSGLTGQTWNNNRESGVKQNCPYRD